MVVAFFFSLRIRSMNDDLSSLIEKTGDLLNQSSYTVAFTGAGVSTPSGIPDFRSPQSGLWEKYDPFAVASLSTFNATPERFFDWIKPLYLQSRDAKPNAAHLALADMEARGRLQSVITQNIDGLHHKAGSKRVIELHGSLQTATCLRCGQLHSGERMLNIVFQTETLPVCSNCGRIIKPDIILYEEALPAMVWQQASQEMQESSVVLVIGSSLETYPANSLPEMAVSHGASLIIMTHSSTPLDRIADVVIHEDVAEVLPAISKLLMD